MLKGSRTCRPARIRNFTIDRARVPRMNAFFAPARAEILLPLTENAEAHLSFLARRRRLVGQPHDERMMSSFATRATSKRPERLQISLIPAPYKRLRVFFRKECAWEGNGACMRITFLYLFRPGQAGQTGLSPAPFARDPEKGHS